ncbi:hypothetical protein MVEN_00036600 [Mycena venus]|uniref:Uncharacterized protein n=1 Tax=Mycena venus TaxID=2733690 RepID=A0A8H7DDT6_9AGAR|nr:hypothetical protein MVEN_00036600 [Mycena venus]
MRARTKKAETLKYDGGAKDLHAKLKAAEELCRQKDLEIQRLHARLNIPSLGPQAGSRLSTPAEAGPSTSNRYISPSLQRYIGIDDHSRHGPLPMKTLDLFPGYRRMTPIAEPRSDFDYAAALNSDVMDRTLQAIVDEHPMYGVDSDDEVLASDPYPIDL